MWREKSIETKKYARAVVDMAHTDRGPGPCRCGGDKVTWGGTARGSIIHCEKCERFVTVPTIEDALERWIA